LLDNLKLPQPWKGVHRLYGAVAFQVPLSTA
jgi:hypothetical protein